MPFQYLLAHVLQKPLAIIFHLRIICKIHTYWWMNERMEGWWLPFTFYACAPFSFVEAHSPHMLERSGSLFIFNFPQTDSKFFFNHLSWFSSLLFSTRMRWSLSRENILKSTLHKCVLSHQVKKIQVDVSNHK